MERIADDRPVRGVVVAQEGLVDLADLEPLRDVHLLGLSRELAERVHAAVIHRGRGRHGRGQECLHLIRLEVVLFEPERELEHIFDAGAWVGGDKVRDEVLLLPRLCGVLIEELFKVVVRAHPRLHHLREGPL